MDLFGGTRETYLGFADQAADSPTLAGWSRAVAEDDARPGDAGLHGRHLRYDVEATAAQVRLDAELLVHDRPEDAVLPPRLLHHRALVEGPVDVAAEVR